MRQPRTWARVITAAAVAISMPCGAQSWAPSKPVRIILPVAASGNDLARTIAPHLQEALGQPVFVDNKPGAGGVIGMDLAAKSPPDGHTLVVGYNGPLAINPTLMEKMPYDPLKDLAPITLAVMTPQYLVVHPSTGITGLADLIAQARADPKRFAYASTGLGSASHLTMEMLKSVTGMSIVHAAYKGSGPALTDTISGNVQMGFFLPGIVLPHVKEGRLRLIASTGEKRIAATPDVPTIMELGYPNFLATTWIGFLAPAGTPAPAVARYNREIVKILRSEELKPKLRDMQFEVAASSPGEFGDWIRAELGRWGKVIKATGAKAE